MKTLRAKFESEAALCGAFIEALPEEWTAYPETAGFDIVLAHGSGVQIGVEAKLLLNAKVITQIIPRANSAYAGHTGPDFRAVLVPYGTFSLEPVCDYLGVTLIGMFGQSDYARFRPDLPDKDSWSDQWFDWCPACRLYLPDYVPDVEAGHPSPLRLTQWKVKAIKLAITLEKRGYLTRADFKHLHISPTRWTQPPGLSWLAPGERRGIYVKRPGKFPDFRAQHPENFAQIEADYEIWALPENALPPVQPNLFEVVG